jgi:hypothetical protein
MRQHAWIGPFDIDLNRSWRAVDEASMAETPLGKALIQRPSNWRISFCNPVQTRIAVPGKIGLPAFTKGSSIAS